MNDVYPDAFRGHSGFRSTEDDAVFELEGVDFEAWIRIDTQSVLLISSVPTLNATVTGDPVAPVVEEGWFETLERRLEDAPSVTDGDVGEPMVTREETTIRVETPLRSGPIDAPADAIAVANYVEGTWIQGIIPGYEYDDRVAGIRDRGRTSDTDPVERS
jgi:hypothetical protein